MGSNFGLFLQDEKGPLWKGSFDDLAEAKRKARELAATARVEAFVYCFKTYREVQRFRPPDEPRPQD